MKPHWTSSACRGWMLQRSLIPHIAWDALGGAICVGVGSASTFEAFHSARLICIFAYRAVSARCRAMKFSRFPPRTALDALWARHVAGKPPWWTFGTMLCASGIAMITRLTRGWESHSVSWCLVATWRRIASRTPPNSAAAPATVTPKAQGISLLVLPCACWTVCGLCSARATNVFPLLGPVTLHRASCVGKLSCRAWGALFRPFVI